jgi:hypothetical protein
MAAAEYMMTLLLMIQSTQLHTAEIVHLYKVFDQKAVEQIKVLTKTRGIPHELG